MKPRTTEEVAFLALGEGVHRWLVEAAATGAQRVRTKMREAVELAALFGSGRSMTPSVWPRWLDVSEMVTWSRSFNTARLQTR